MERLDLGAIIHGNWLVATVLGSVFICSHGRWPFATKARPTSSLSTFQSTQIIAMRLVKICNKAKGRLCSAIGL